MTIRAVDVDAPDLPEGSWIGRGLRRPGEMHEAVVVPADVAAAINAKAQASAVPTSLAAALLLELHVLQRELHSCGVSLPEPPQPLVERRLTAAEARYLRGLTWRRPGERPLDATVALPVRLLAHASEATIRDAADADLDRAIQWEAAAIASGRTILELGLRIALARATNR